MKVTVEIDQAESGATVVVTGQRPIDGVRTWPPFTVRLPPVLRAEMHKRARASGRSVTSEVMFQLAQAYGFHLGEFEGRFDSNQVSVAARSTDGR